jgi:hypothetical protein
MSKTRAKPRPAKKSKGGAPKKEETRKMITVRLLEEEKSAFGSEATERGLPMTTWMVRICRKACGLDP